MHRAEARELGLREARQRAEDALLLADPQLRLEADDVVEHAALVLLPQLHDGVRPLAGARVPSPTGFIGP